MIAEARCQRALAYLTLLKCFGEYWKQDSQYGVCLFKDELVRDDQVRQRSSVADTYKLISEDLRLCHRPLRTASGRPLSHEQSFCQGFEGKDVFCSG